VEKLLSADKQQHEGAQEGVAAEKKKENADDGEAELDVSGLVGVGKVRRKA
jgi:hypothetical protein